MQGGRHRIWNRGSHYIQYLSLGGMVVTLSEFQKLQVFADLRGIRIRQRETVLDRREETEEGNVMKQYSVKSSNLVVPVSSYFIPR